MIKKNIPVDKNSEKYEELNEIWKRVYNSRKEKVGIKRAKISANSRVHSELLKEFIEDNKKEKKSLVETIIVEEKKYNDYELGDIKVITTTDKKVLNKFPGAERSGKFKDIKDAFGREIVSKLLDKYEASIHPDMYYIVVGNN